MKIIVGLGNIGAEYQDTRHNIGFYALDHFLEQNQIPATWKEEKKLKAYTTKVSFNGKLLLLVKPTTYMNLSGEATSKVLNFFKAQSEDLIVIYDDIDLPLGKIRVRDKGSAGTHNGMKSIIQSLGTENFHRLRIGIESRGETAAKQQDLASFVLSKFTKEEVPQVISALDEANQELEKLISA